MVGIGIETPVVVGPGGEEIDAAVAGLTVPDAFRRRVAVDGAETALRWRASGGWRAWTWSEYAELADRAAGLLHERGVGPGQRVVLALRNRPEFHVFDLAAQLCGAVPISVYATASAEELGYVVSHSGATLVIGEDGSVGAGAESDQRLDSEVRLRSLVIEDAILGSTEATEAALSGAAASVPSPAAEPEDLATVIYTSGTTGSPKGVMLTQRNVCWTVESIRRTFGADLRDGDFISYLPMAHIAERNSSHYLPIVAGGRVTTCPDPTAVLDYLPEVRPRFFFGVPRIWEKVAERMQAHEAEAGSVLETLGLDRCEVAMVGAAPAGLEMLEYLNARGVPLGEVYGLSENTGPMTFDAAHDHPGTVGLPIPGCEVTLLDDGEVVCRGGNVFAGYLDRPDISAEVLDPSGWMRTGDIGELSEDGYLRIVDRKKDLLITAGGENVSPANIEAMLRAHPLVDQVCVIGDGRPYVAAILTVDHVGVETWAARVGLGDLECRGLLHTEQFEAEIAAHVDSVNSRLSRLHRVKRHRVIEDVWTPVGGELTPTLKLKRRVVLAEYAGMIEEVYAK